MAHKKLPNGNAVVDWETGDKEGDRKYLFQAYHDFFKLLLEKANAPHDMSGEDAYDELQDLIIDWQISVDNQVDDFPRVWISRPKND